MRKRNAFVWIHIIVPVFMIFTLAYLSFANVASHRNPSHLDGFIIASTIIHLLSTFFSKLCMCTTPI